MTITKRPDLVVYTDGRPLAIVEAKGRPVGRQFEGPVLRQLQLYVTNWNTPWSILVDPDETRIYRRSDLTRPFITLSTGEVLESTGLAKSSVVGERVLVRALDRWLHDLPKHREALVRRHPGLRDFVNEVAEGITSIEESSSQKYRV